MKAFWLLIAIALVATTRADSLRLILVPQQTVITPDASHMKFDLFLYNEGKSERTVPSLDEFRALYNVRGPGHSDSESGTQVRAFSHPIKDHTLKAQRVDHTVIEIDFSSEGVEVGHDERTLISNSVLLLFPPVSATPTESPSSPKPAATAN
jgi:hypothetical protein